MGQHGQAVGRPDRLDRLDRAEAAARHVARLPPAQQPREGILDAVRVARPDEGAGDGRPTERVVGRARHVEQVVVDREVEIAQPGDGQLEALAPSATLLGQGRLEGGVVRIHPEAEDMQLALPQAEIAVDDRVDLDARDERQAGRHGRRRPRPRDSRPACRGRSGPGAGRRPRPPRRRGPPERRHRPNASCGCGGRSSRGSGGRPAGPGRRQGVVTAAAPAGRHLRPRRDAGSARWPGRARSPDRCRPGPR